MKRHDHRPSKVLILLGALLLAGLITAAIAYADNQDAQSVALRAAQDIPTASQSQTG